MHVTAKSPFRSKTIWGAIILVLTIVLQGFGVEFAEGEVSHLSYLIGEIVGVLMVVWGRYTATQPIAKPKPDLPIRMTMLALCMAAVLPMQSGCTLFGPKHEGGMRQALEQGAKMALLIGLNELGDRVKETRDYLPPIIHGIEIAFERSDDPVEIAESIAADVRANVPIEWHNVMLAELAESLHPDPDRPATFAAEDYNAELAAAILSTIR